MSTILYIVQKEYVFRLLEGVFVALSYIDVARKPKTVVIYCATAINTSH